jgi:hypothetical protein
MYYSIRPGDLATITNNTANQLQTVLTAATNALVESLQTQTINSPSETLGGLSQWTEVMFPITSLTRLGGHAAASLSTCNGVRVLVDAIGTVTVRINSFWIGGGAQGDVGDNGAPYRYRMKPRSSTTGAQGNPSPEMRYGVRPRRAGTYVYPPSNPTDPQVTIWDVYRYGGTVTSYRWIGTTPIGVPFLDNYSDQSAQGGDVLITDDLEPWPSIGLPVYIVSGGGVAITSVGQFLFVTASALPANVVDWLPGTLIQLNSIITVTLRSRPVASWDTGLGIQFELDECIFANNWTTLTVLEPVIADVPHPYLWGPDEQGTLFSAGDIYRPGGVSYTKRNNLDSAPSKNFVELAPPSEPILGGAVIRGISLASSSARWWGLYPDLQGGGYSPNSQPVGRPLIAPFAHCTDGQFIYFWTKDGIASTDGGPYKSLTDADLYILFPHGDTFGQDVTRNGHLWYAPNYAYAAAFRLAISNNYLYADYLDSNLFGRTLVCDLRNGAWSQDVYGTGAIFARCHWGLDQQASTTNVGPTPAFYPYVVMADAAGNIYQFFDGQNDAGEGIVGVLGTREWDGGDGLPNGLWDDLYIDANLPFGAQAQPTSLGSLIAAPTTVAAGNRNLTQVQVGNGTMLRFLGLQLTWTDTNGFTPTTLYQFQYQTVPNRVSAWRTQWLSHGQAGFQTIYYIEAAWASTTNITLQIQTYDGQAPANITLPGSSGAYQRTKFSVSPNKGRLFRYGTTSSAPYQLILGDFIIWVGPWGRRDLALPFRLVASEAPESVRV